MVFTEEEIRKFRHDTPGCTHRIHLNSAGASLMPQPVLNAIHQHLALEGEVGGYEAADLKYQQIEEFYQAGANLLKTHTRNLAFTANATDSFSRALSSIPFRPGDAILTSNEDYISNQIQYLSLQKRLGIKLVRARSLASGGIDLNDFEQKLKSARPVLVAITHIPTNSGLIQPVEEIGKMVAATDSLYLVDACQSVGQVDIDVKKLQCDFLSATSRKFLRGPRGAGFLYVSDKALNQGLAPLFVDMRGAAWKEKDEYTLANDAKRYEDWETAYALMLGTTAALKYATSIGLNRIEQQIQYLTDAIRTKLRAVEKVTVLDKGPRLGGIITIKMEVAAGPAEVKKFMNDHRVNVVPTYREYAVIDFDEKQVQWALRISPHVFNTMEEIETFVEMLRQAIRSFGK
jgi:selenocysteine lyase/cysteine desulfurase